MFVISNVLQGAAMVLDKVLWLYSMVVMVAVLITWVSPDPFNPVVQCLRSVTEPVFAWVRRYLPFTVVGMIDLSPLVVFFLIRFCQVALVRSLFDLAVRLR